MIKFNDEQQLRYDRLIQDINDASIVNNPRINKTSLIEDVDRFVRSIELDKTLANNTILANITRRLLKESVLHLRFWVDEDDNDKPHFDLIDNEEYKTIDLTAKEYEVLINLY